MKRISVDSNTINADPRERVYIPDALQPKLLHELADGEKVMVYDEELEMEANIELDGETGRLYGVLDPSTLRYFLTDEEFIAEFYREQRERKD